MSEGERGFLAMEAKPPLTTLLSWAWIAFAMEADNAVDATDPRHVGARFRISLAMWANALRVIGDDGTTLDELRYAARAGANIGGLERWGWISVGDVAAGRREGYGTSRGLRGDTVLRLTRAGAFACELWPRVIADVEERWETRFGRDVLAALRRALSPLGHGMPSAPPEVAPSDGFRTHVITAEADDMRERPLGVLLGQALTQLTLEHELGAVVSLPVAANALRVIDAKTVAIRDLPASSGVSKEAVAMLVSFLQRRGLAEVGAQRTITLTTGGLAALDGYVQRAEQTSNPELRSCISAIVSRRDSLARGLVPPERSWRWNPPYAAQTRRFIADPTAALPWHPMVLHRGGWPDGS